MHPSCPLLTLSLMSFLTLPLRPPVPIALCSLPALRGPGRADPTLPAGAAVDARGRRRPPHPPPGPVLPHPAPSPLRMDPSPIASKAPYHLTRPSLTRCFSFHPCMRVFACICVRCGQELIACGVQRIAVVVPVAPSIQDALANPSLANTPAHPPAAATTAPAMAPVAMPPTAGGGGGGGGAGTRSLRPSFDGAGPYAGGSGGGGGAGALPSIAHPASANPAANRSLQVCFSAYDRCLEAFVSSPVGYSPPLMHSCVVPLF